MSEPPPLTSDVCVAILYMNSNHDEKCDCCWLMKFKRTTTATNENVMEKQKREREREK